MPAPAVVPAVRDRAPEACILRPEKARDANSVACYLTRVNNQLGRMEAPYAPEGRARLPAEAGTLTCRSTALRRQSLDGFSLRQVGRMKAPCAPEGRARLPAEAGTLTCNGPPEGGTPNQPCLVRRMRSRGSAFPRLPRQLIFLESAKSVARMCNGFEDRNQIKSAVGLCSKSLARDAQRI